MTSKPKIKIHRDLQDIILECCTGLLLVFIWVFPLIHFGELPDTIPTHYDVLGKPDSWGDKSNLFIIPLITTVTLIGIFLANQAPHKFNYGSRMVSEKNARAYYRASTRLLRWISLVVAGFMTYLEYQIVMSALAGQFALKVTTLGILVIGLLVPIIIYFRELRKLGAL